MRDGERRTEAGGRSDGGRRKEACIMRKEEGGMRNDECGRRNEE